MSVNPESAMPVSAEPEHETAMVPFEHEDGTVEVLPVTPNEAGEINKKVNKRASY